jgi:hypothetical protein
MQENAKKKRIRRSNMLLFTCLAITNLKSVFCNIIGLSSSLKKIILQKEREATEKTTYK